MKLNHLTADELLQMNQYTFDELERRSILKVGGNPISEYTLWLVKNKMNAKSVSSDFAGYNVRTPDKKKIQILAKRNKLKNHSTILGVISERELRMVDDVLAVIYNEDMSIRIALIIPVHVIEKIGVYNKFQKDYTLRINAGIISDANVVNMKMVLSNEFNFCGSTNQNKEDIVHDLKIVGKRTFVEYYQYYIDDVDVNYVIEKMLLDKIEWKVATARSKAKKMKSIFKKGENLKALKLIFESRNYLITESTKEKVIEILEKNHRELKFV